MKRFILFFAAASWLHAQTAAPATTVFAEIDKIETQLSAITGLSFTHKVPSADINKTQLRAFLEDQVKEQIKPEELHAQELTLKLLGLVPQDFDLKSNTVDLLTEQAAAFYDYRKKKLFVLDSKPGTEQTVALAHELSHALADQHFHLEKFLEGAGKSDDGSMARLAVMEGQASWLMTAYLAKSMGQAAEAPEGMLELMSNMMSAGATQFPVYSKAPLYIQSSLIFPYSTGMVFQDAVFRKSGKAAFAQVFQHPPASTQQMLHPEKYFADVKPDLPSYPALPNTKGYKELAKGTLGEFDLNIILEQFNGKEIAKKVAPHLTGAVYRVWEQKDGEHPVLAISVRWDTEQSADEFFHDYREALKKKWKTFQVETDQPQLLAGRGDAGPFRVTLDGTTVVSMEGVADPIK